MAESSWCPAVSATTASTEEAVGDEDNGQEFGDYIGLTVASGQPPAGPIAAAAPPSRSGPRHCRPRASPPY